MKWWQMGQGQTTVNVCDMKSLSVSWPLDHGHKGHLSIVPCFSNGSFLYLWKQAIEVMWIASALCSYVALLINSIVRKFFFKKQCPWPSIRSIIYSNHDWPYLYKSSISLSPLSLFFRVLLIKSDWFSPNVNPPILSITLQIPLILIYQEHSLQMLLLSIHLSFSCQIFLLLSEESVLDPLASFPFFTSFSGLFWLNALVTMTTLTILKPLCPPLTSVPIYIFSVNQSSPLGIQMHTQSI